MKPGIDMETETVQMTRRKLWPALEDFSLRWPLEDLSLRWLWIEDPNHGKKTFPTPKKKGKKR